MILHLFDDEKVVNRSIDIFEEAFPSNNIFVVRVIDKPQHVLPGKSILFYRDGDFNNLSANCINSIKCITIHSMQLWKIDYILSLGIKPSKIFWCVWGADMYNSILINFGYNFFYEPNYVPGYFKSKILSLFARIKVYPSSVKKTLDFVKQYVTVLKTTREEYFIQKQFLGNFLNCGYVEIPLSIYYSINDILSTDLISRSVFGNKIIVGNSASFSNNHLYAYEILSQFNIGKREIISPLSYGGDDRYRSHVIKKGKEFFKTNYIPLMDFISLNEYNQLLLQAEVCIYANWRQEAMGNILVSIFLGAKVFLSKKSPLIQRFERIGIKVFCLEDITQIELDTPLSVSEKQNNREILLRNLKRNTIIEGIRQVWPVK